MQDMLYTRTGDRPDLAGLIVNPPESYIGNRILPIVSTSEKSGTLYYRALTADVAAQTGRVAGAAPTSTQISDTSTTFTCAENVKRASITPDEVKVMGGIAKADEVGGKFAIRQVLNAIESDVATNIVGGAADYTFDAAKAKTQMQVALDAIRQYEGRTTIIASTKVLQAMVQNLIGDSVQGKVLSRIVSGTSSVAAAQGLSFDSWLGAIALYFGVDDVLAGDSTIWNAGDNAGKFAVAKLADSNDPLAHKYMPVLGKTLQFIPDGAASPFSIQSVGDRTNINNHYDCFAWFDTVVLNTGAFKVFGGVADA